MMCLNHLLVQESRSRRLALPDTYSLRQSERIRAHNPIEITLWQVPNAGHCGAVTIASQEFDTRVLGWFTSHDGGYPAPTPR